MTRSSILSSLRWLTVVVVLLAAGSSRAQLGIYGMGTGGHESGPNVGQLSFPNGNGSFIAWGGTGGIYYDFLHLGPAHLGADGRFFLEHTGNNTPYGNKLEGGLGGLRLDGKLPIIPLRPYVQAEVGGVGTNNGIQSTLTTGVAYQVQFGLDVTIFPHFDLRGEYGVGNIFLDGSSPVLQQFGGGVVIRL
jgi:hypothetical protein